MVKIVNFKSATKSKDGWLPWETLVKYTKKSNGGNLPKKMRVFMLDPWYVRRLQIDYNQRAIRGVLTEKTDTLCL